MTRPRAEPLTFGAPDRPCFGWLHRPSSGAPRRGIGLVICKPFGYEAISSDRSLRHFAQAAADLGVHALRFDYDGTGDSAGSDRDPGRVRSWVDSVHAAIDELKRLAIVDRIHLLGVRLGATLASLAAADRSDIAGLIAIVPVVAGKAWLREANALEQAMGLPGPPPGVAQPAGESESVGFVITAETKETLLRMDLLALPRAPAGEVLILDRNDLAGKTKWAEQLTATGAVVDHRFLPGYAEMMLDPHEAVVPNLMIAAAVDWLAQRAPVVVANQPSVAVRPAVNMQASPGVQETAGFLDDSATIFGVVSAPSGVPQPTSAIMLLNSGAIPHVGPGRLYVDLARRWASRGFLVLRFDQAGIGDSPAFPGEAENVVYSPSALRGIALALAALEKRWGIAQTKAVGLCSGAYHAFKAAAAGASFTGLALINPLVFFWKPGMSLAYPPYHVSAATAQYRRSVFQWSKWKKVFAGQVDISAVVQVVSRRAASALEGFARNIARAVRRPLPDDLGAELETVARVGVPVRFIFATGDPGEDLLRSEAGWTLPRLERAQRVRIVRIDGPNHSFTPVWSRAVLSDILETELHVR